MGKTTVIVIGILAAVVIPKNGRKLLDKLNAYTSAHQIAADMRYARRLAITAAKDHIVRFNPETQPYTEYGIFYDDGGSEVQVGETRQITSEVTCNGDDRELSFQPLGSAAADGILSLIVGEYQYDVNLLSTTGKVSVERYEE